MMDNKPKKKRKTRKREEKQPISVNLTTIQRLTLQAIADKQCNGNVSQLCRTIIQDYLNKNSAFAAIDMSSSSSD